MRAREGRAGMHGRNVAQLILAPETIGTVFLRNEFSGMQRNVGGGIRESGPAHGDLCVRVNIYFASERARKNGSQQLRILSASK